MEKTPENWKGYAEQAKERPPYPSLAQAISLVKEKGAALDLGAGALGETRALLDAGFKRVVAIDAEPSLSERVKELGNEDRLEAIVTNFEDYNFPLEHFDLLALYYAAPFMSRESFDEMFPKLKASLKKEGVLVGNLFGERDFRNTRPDRTTLTQKEVEALFSDMKIIKLVEDEEDAPTYDQGVQHWHVWHVIARKK